jgi:ATP-dependent helicase/nuclease subunit B
VNGRAPIRFLLGPAGSGKTFCALEEIRAELQAAPEGPPLVLLAPKQATYQLERQLLERGELDGFTRLHILSFERLATFVLAQLRQPEPKLLGEEGRLMLLRALLLRNDRELRMLCAPARLPGFAQQISGLLRELRRARIAPQQLRELAAKPGRDRQLQAKLSDLALLMECYETRLQADALRDADQLLDIATAALRAPGSGLRPEWIGGLWMDGFAEMTPQELELLAALQPHCGRTTLAFCLDQEPVIEPEWLSTWTVVAQTFGRCRLALSRLPGAQVEVRMLARDPQRSRFGASETLAHLEQQWVAAAPVPYSRSPADVAVAACPDPEAEAILAAREVRRFVRAEPGRRYRDCAVLLRSLEKHHNALRRVFTRFRIPFFLDRREEAAHHPLAEVTRLAMRLAARDWQNDDWLGLLKTGLLPVPENPVDRLENSAREHGIEGRDWCKPQKWQAAEKSGLAGLAKLARQCAAPFEQFIKALQKRPTGRELAAGFQGLWKELGVARQLEDWSLGDAAVEQEPGRVHATVWQQMQDWLANLELAFAEEAVPLHEWLPIVEAGLAGLSVGVVPPAIDQVMIGTLDRSRNPDLKLAVVLGMNETLLPAPPAAAQLLTEAERQLLDGEGACLGPGTLQRLGHERYYGYIACTRPRQRLVLGHARTDAEGRACNPSPFLAHLQRIFPELAVETFSGETAWRDGEHSSELLPAVLRDATKPVPTQEPLLSALAAEPAFKKALAHQAQLAGAASLLRVNPARLEEIHGRDLESSVSALEEFAACPFKFFVARTLGAREQKDFAVKARHRGSFQHELLRHFHKKLTEEKRRWRDLEPGEAATWIDVLGTELEKSYDGGRFAATPKSRFAARMLTEATARLVEVLIGWMSQYAFDPVAVELEFGLQGALPAWPLELEAGHRLLLRGRIDRVDLHHPGSAADTAGLIVVDYKSSQQKLHASKLRHGLQLQLPAYLAMLTGQAEAAKHFGVATLAPAGMFYVSLRSTFGGSAETRDAAMDGGEQKTARLAGYAHEGMFDSTYRERLDNRGEKKGDQFRYHFTDKGVPRGGAKNDGREPEAFHCQLEETRQRLITIGNEIFAGAAGVAPYMLGKGSSRETACERCDYRSVCRFDPWRDSYRVLKSAPPA